MTRYSKVHLSYADQVSLLKRRGLDVGDNLFAEHALERFGYYRLAGYWVPFLQASTGDFNPGASLENVLHLYEYDKLLRLHVLAGLERIEIATRVRIAHHLGRIDPFALERPELLDRRFATGGYATWILRYQARVQNTTDQFVLDFLRQYGEPLPIWLGIELWDFGMLSWFFQGMRTRDRDSVAAGLKLENGKVLRSWLHSMSVTRNICAHHGRFWNRTLSRPVALPGKIVAPELHHLRMLSPVDSRRQYSALCCIAYVLDHMDPQDDWKLELVDHFQAFPQIPEVTLSDMGLPSDWMSQSIWNRVEGE